MFDDVYLLLSPRVVVFVVDADTVDVVAVVAVVIGVVVISFCL